MFTGDYEYIINDAWLTLYYKFHCRGTTNLNVIDILLQIISEMKNAELKGSNIIKYNYKNELAIFARDVRSNINLADSIKRVMISKLTVDSTSGKITSGGNMLLNVELEKLGNNPLSYNIVYFTGINEITDFKILYNKLVNFSLNNGKCCFDSYYNFNGLCHLTKHIYNKYSEYTTSENSAYINYIPDIFRLNEAFVFSALGNNITFKFNLEPTDKCTNISNLMITIYDNGTLAVSNVRISSLYDHTQGTATNAELNKYKNKTTFQPLLINILICYYYAVWFLTCDIDYDKIVSLINPQPN